MKFSLYIPLLSILYFSYLTLANAQNRDRLRIVKKDTFSVTEPISRWNSLIMDDSSVIILAGISSWNVEIGQAEIGKGCKIFGIGERGLDQPRAANGNPGPECGRGGNGQSGLNGGNGGDGVNVKMYINIIGIGSLTIDVRGGDGGDGGDGGHGGSGGKADIASNCRGGLGGEGGNGGNGGRGGKGGDIEIYYSTNGERDNDPNFGDYGVINSINIINQAGENGFPGRAGAGGAGGMPVRKNLGFASISKGGGSGGSRGDTGLTPQSNVNGQTKIIRIGEFDCLADVGGERKAILIGNSTEDQAAKFKEQIVKLHNTLESENYRFSSIDTMFNITRGEFYDLIAKISEDESIQDSYFIYVTGHGFNKSNKAGIKTPEGDIYLDDIFISFKNLDVKRVLLCLNVCHAGKIFSNSQIIESTPQPSSAKTPIEVCNRRAFTVVTSGYDDAFVPVEDFTNQLIVNLKRMEYDSYFTAEQLFSSLIKYWGNMDQYPMFGKYYDYSLGDFIFYKSKHNSHD